MYHKVINVSLSNKYLNSSRIFSNIPMSCVTSCWLLSACVPSDRVQPRHEAPLLCERDHAQPEQQELAVRLWQTQHTDGSLDFQNKRPLNVLVCSQDQSSGFGAAGSGLPGERRPWHHSLCVWQLQRGCYTFSELQSDIHQMQTKYK